MTAITRVRMLAVALAGLVAVGCGKSSTTTSPSTTTTGPSTEYFTGTLSPTTSSFYSFTVTNQGAVSVTLASETTAKVGPAVSSPIALGLGVPIGFGCSLSSSADVSPGLSAQLTNPSSAAGIYCVSVADPGTLSADVIFVVRIVHT
jgi:hypothetical protein